MKTYYEIQYQSSEDPQVWARSHGAGENCFGLQRVATQHACVLQGVQPEVRYRVVRIKEVVSPEELKNTTSAGGNTLSYEHENQDTHNISS